MLRDSILADNLTTPKGHTEADCFATAREDPRVSLGGNVLTCPNCVLMLAVGDVVTAKPIVLPLAKTEGQPKTWRSQRRARRWMRRTVTDGRPTNAAWHVRSRAR
jgi:hypothetical protein